eukprot:CAMPEP_0178962910 /NCGR_PEP_ID=MMETSP0789-20121207/14669_1 /TAXON_ID=3005 /ORGANISM="Rhizosolenia setigera, Strain CCMP 1694" /LENGTH=136 /DNA_ID=CAMNT_0020647197 /DNA_START=116 /DNA_END=526 /DNA_ORIENTATION=+
MGGGNAQKSAMARAKNQAKQGKTAEERKAASDKAKKDSSAYICKVCKQTFMVNATKAILYQHVVAKHDPNKPLTDYFDALEGFDPADPKGLKAAAKEKAAKEAAAAKKKKKAAKGGGDMLDLLDAGLAAGKKKKKK